MLSNHRTINLDEPIAPSFSFGETVLEPILITTTPTVTLTDLQFDHLSLVRRFKYDTIEEALQKRHSNEHKGSYLGY